MQTTIEYETQSPTSTTSSEIENYADILNLHGLDYKEVGFYLVVREITATQGWILHLSVIISQIVDLLKIVIHFLANTNIPFKIVVNESVAEDLLIGNLGLAQIGKIVCIYPTDDKSALSIAKDLVRLTSAFKGPAIPTDICLGSIVYTRYGSFNPIVKNNIQGVEEKYIYDHQGSLVKDSYSIPFHLAAGQTFPFKDLAHHVPPPVAVLSNRLYKVLNLLKADPRGNVFKGLYLKHLLSVKSCVLKQGIINAASDMSGRDMKDRLYWQAEIYQKLSKLIPMPTIYEILDEPGFSLLVMQYIKGTTIYQRAKDLNPFCLCWQNLPPSVKLELNAYANKITRLIETLHSNGYIHRDVIPVNFMVTKTKQLYFIDMELTYSMHENKPNPPFLLGTPGFMSPEQEARLTPTPSQDIYSLGATLLYIYTGLTPTRFCTTDPQALAGKLVFFIADNEIALMIANTLSHVPNLRPSLVSISETINNYNFQLKSQNNHLHSTCEIKLDLARLNDTITMAIKGLTRPPIVSSNQLWYSKKLKGENFSSTVNRQFAQYPGVTEGMSGPLYVLARLNKSHINIESCRSRFNLSWEFIEKSYLTNVDHLQPGLYHGAAGLALALVTSIDSGLLADSDSNRKYIQKCLTLKTNEFTLANGLPGQGIAYIKCRHFLSEAELKQNLNHAIDLISINQRKTNFWIEFNAPTQGHFFDLGHDGIGILYFLLEYQSVFPSETINYEITRTLNNILADGKYILGLLSSLNTRDGFEIGDGGKGLVLTFIKAYKVLGNPKYREFAETALSKYPDQFVHPNFTQKNGLSGLGEVYIDAWQAFKNEKWKNRAFWIANLYLTTFFKNTTGEGYWKMEEYEPPTAALFSGVSGIIHFLARCLDPINIGHRLLE
jgi:serine/threonine protein kinase